MNQIMFRGQSGKAYSFTRMAVNAPWARHAGIGLFAARGPFGWRVVRVMDLRGRLHDVQPIWAFADAERYGANTVFVYDEPDAEVRARICMDLQAGLDPLIESEPFRLAA